MKEKVRKLFTNVWTVPNVLTMIRLALIPVFAAFFFRGEKHAALAVFAAASVTDFLDGYIARTRHQITDFGKLFDPLADKLMVLTALICQGLAGVFPWAAIIIVLIKEIMLMLGSALMLDKGIVVYANYFGKTAQVFFILSLIGSFFHEELATWGTQLDVILLWISVGLCVLALTAYATGAWKQIRKPAGERPNGVPDEEK